VAVKGYVAVENAGSALDPADCNTWPAVAVGPNLVIVAVPAPIKTEWFVNPVNCVVKVFPDPVVVVLPVPNTFKILEDGVAVPELDTYEVATEGHVANTIFGEEYETESELSELLIVPTLTCVPPAFTNELPIQSCPLDIKPLASEDCAFGALA